MLNKSSSNVLAFDIGGSSTKIAIFDEKRNFIKKDKVFYNDIEAQLLLQLIKEKIIYYKEFYNIKTICFSTCGVVTDKKTISGMSAIKNYNGTDWTKELALFKVPIYLENDCKCSLLAEHYYGVGQNHQNLVSLVLGSGIGGGVIINNQFLKGTAGEFGCFLNHFENEKYINLSQYASPVNVQKKLNSYFKTNKQLSAYFKMYYDDSYVRATINKMLYALGKAIINISFTINPELIIIGGGISENKWFISKLNKKVIELMKLSGMPQNFQVIGAQFKNDANLLGAYSLFENKQMF